MPFTLTSLSLISIHILPAVPMMLEQSKHCIQNVCILAILSSLNVMGFAPSIVEMLLKTSLTLLRNSGLNS
jgi:hypothetical protein